MTARDETEVDRLGVTQAAALRDLHRVDVADQVGDARVRRGELLEISFVASAPRDRQAVAQLGSATQAHRGDGFEGVLAELGAFDDRRPFVEQAGQGAQQTGLALPALAEQHDVVPGYQGSLQLRDDGGLEAVEPGPRITTLAQGG